MNDYKIKEFKQPNTEEATKLILSEDITRSAVSYTHLTLPTNREV